VRVVASNDGRDQSAFLVTCRDALRGGDYDLVVKLHSKKSVQDGANNGDHFRQHQFMNLLNSRGYAANLVGLFQREPRLGLVFPPMIHVGAATLGRGWATNLPRFTETAARLGITVPLDDVSPLAPYGGMFVARPEALELLTREQWTFEQFGGEGSYGDGGLAHVLERMPVYAAAQAGYYARTVSTTEYMSVSHPSMEFKLDQISATTAGYPHEQIEFLRRAGFIGEGRLADVTQMYLRLHRPNLLRVFQPILSRTTTLGVQKRRNKTKADRA
jgi:rhamnosyltransferase